MKTTRGNSLYLELKLKEMALLGKPNPEQPPIVCCLEKSVIKDLTNIAFKQGMLRDKLIDKVVNEFNLQFEDIMYLTKQIYEKSYLEKIKNLLTYPEDREFITFQVSKQTFDRLNNAKQFFKLNKSVILKYMLLQYTKENNV